MICNIMQPTSWGFGPIATMNGCLTRPAACKTHVDGACAKLHAVRAVVLALPAVPMNPEID